MTCFGLLFIFWCEEPLRQMPAVHCPPLVEYDKNAQARAADQLRALPPGSPARKLVADYGDLRARCRALESKGATGG